MNSKIIENTTEKQGSNYPYLGLYKEGNDMVVLFSEPDTGMVVWSGFVEINEGCYRNWWDESDFARFTGKIELSN